MRVSLCNEVLGSLPFERQCQMAAKLGYDGLEIAPFTLGDDPTLLSASARGAIRQAARNAGISVTGLHYILRAPAGLSITSPDDAVRARTLEVMRRLCELAHDLGAGIVVHGSPDQRQVREACEADDRRRGAECFAGVADAAASAGVTYCIEPLSPDQTGFVNTIEEAAAIVRQIDSPAVRTMIDCSSAARGGETESIPQLIAKWLPTGLIAHVHLNDPNRRGPGEGAFPFAPILAALRQHGFAGDAAIEPFVYQPDGATCAARSIGYIQGILQTLDHQ